MEYIDRVNGAAVEGCATLNVLRELQQQVLDMGQAIYVRLGSLELKPVLKESDPEIVSSGYCLICSRSA